MTGRIASESVGRGSGEDDMTDLGKSVLSAEPGVPTAPSVDGLIARLEQASGGNQRLDAEIYILRSLWKDAEALFVSSDRDSWGTIAIFRRTADGCAAISWDFPRYTTSLDAALTLVPEGWDWNIGSSSSFGRAGFFGYVRGDAEDPPDPEGSFHGPSAPLALCIAALKARQAMPQPERVSDRTTSNTDAAQEMPSGTPIAGGGR